MTTEERVVLLDDSGAGIGAAPKAQVHHTRTPLHLAFSCYLFDEASGDLLVTRRALTKRTWPGVWTNSFCGHPEPFEPIPDAVARRARDEIGVALRSLRLALPDFRYRAIDASGVVENEICPVYIATAADRPVANPAEVMDMRWVSPDALGDAVAAAPWLVSPWMVDQLAELRGAGIPLRAHDAPQARHTQRTLDAPHPHASLAVTR